MRPHQPGMDGGLAAASGGIYASPVGNKNFFKSPPAAALKHGILQRYVVGHRWLATDLGLRPRAARGWTLDRPAGSERAAPQPRRTSTSTSGGLGVEIVEDRSGLIGSHHRDGRRA